MRKNSSAALAKREMPKGRSPQKREREEEKGRSGSGKAGSECVSGCSKCGGSRRGWEGSGEGFVKVEKEAEQEKGMRGNVHRRVAS